MVRFGVSATVTDDEQELTALVRSARTGDPSAFEQLAVRVRSRVLGWARQVSRDPDDAEDIAQLVLLRLHRRLDRFASRGRFTGWLQRVTTNLAHDVARSRRRTGALTLDHARAIPAQSAPAGKTHDFAALVVASLEGLSARQREILLMSDLDGLDSAAVAGRLGISASTVRVHLARARRLVRARILASHPDLRLDDDDL